MNKKKKEKPSEMLINLLLPHFIYNRITEKKTIRIPFRRMPSLDLIKVKKGILIGYSMCY